MTKRLRSLALLPILVLAGCGGDGGGSSPTPVSATATITSNPKTVHAGEAAILTWHSTDAVYAETSFEVDSSPSSPDSRFGGSQTFRPNVTTTYSLTVKGPDGKTVVASTTVTVLPAR